MCVERLPLGVIDRRVRAVKGLYSFGCGRLSPALPFSSAHEIHEFFGSGSTGGEITSGEKGIELLQ